MDDDHGISGLPRVCERVESFEEGKEAYGIGWRAHAYRIQDIWSGLHIQAFRVVHTHCTMVVTGAMQASLCRDRGSQLIPTIRSLKAQRKNILKVIYPLSYCVYESRASYVPRGVKREILCLV